MSSQINSRLISALQALVNFEEADPDMLLGDDGTLDRIMSEAHAAIAEAKSNIGHKFVIQNIADLTYWSNTWGWGDRGEATEFTEAERDHYHHIPHSGRWMPA